MSEDINRKESARERRRQAFEQEVASRAEDLQFLEEETELWQASSRAYNGRRREENRQAWSDFHAGQAERLRRALEELLSHHAQQAEKYAKQPEGAT